MEPTLEYARSILESQPFSMMLGTELKVFEPGRAELQLNLTDKLRQQHGFVHGGVLSYLADNALTFAGGSVLGDSLTAEYKINYLRPAAGTRLIARAEVVKGGRRQAVCQCRIFAHEDDEDVLVAIATGTIIPVGEARHG